MMCYELLPPNPQIYTLKRKGVGDASPCFQPAGEILVRLKLVAKEKESCAHTCLEVFYNITGCFVY